MTWCGGAADGNICKALLVRVICHASRYDPTTSPVSSARPRRPQQIAKIHHYIELATVDLQTDPSALFAVTVMY